MEKRGILAALRYRNYRFLWGSALGVTTAVSMEMVVLGWLVLELTDSPSLVGLVAACRFAGMALGPYFGALADRLDRRRLLIIVRVAGGIYTLILAVLYYLSLLEVWHIFVLALGGGVVRAFDFTTGNSTVPETVERHHLASAISLLLVAMGITRMIGPLIGGYLFEQTGAGACFAVMAGAYFLASLILSPMRLVSREKPLQQEPVWKSVTGGIQYVLGDRALFSLIILAAIANLFAFPVSMGIMPVVARDVFHVGSSGLGWLVAAEGLGGLIGALLVVPLGRFRHKGWVLILSMIIWPAFLGIFATSHLFSLSLLLLAASGVARGIAMAVIQLLLLSWSSQEVHGRVMGARMFAIVTLPLGNILSGAGAGFWGAATVITVNALACIFTTILTALWATQLRHRQ